MGTPTSVQKDWEALSREIEQSECARVYPGSNLVIGRGSLTPKVVFVGEAPGAEEDRLKMPFVGRSGHMLDSWIAACGLGAYDYYICNVMKTRPPENRNPTPDEVKLCAPLLEKQLALLKPKIVVAVGRFGMNYFFPKKKSILSESGIIHEHALAPVFIIPHPSYFLRNGGKGWEPYVEKLSLALGAPAQIKGEKQVRLG